MRKIFVINGLPGTGKTLFGSLVGTHLARAGINFVHTSSIDPVKHLLLPQALWNEKVVPVEMWEILHRLKREITDQDWDGYSKEVYWRGAMSRLKARLMAFDDDFINRWVWSRVEQIEDGIVFVDIRERENILSFANYCGKADPETSVSTVCVQSNLSAEYDNSSDAGVNDLTYDIYIDNSRDLEGDSKKRLDETVNRFVNEEILNKRDGGRERGVK